MKKVTAEGKTVEEAIAAGLQMLGRPREQVEIHILEEPGRRFLGLLGKRLARVELVWQPDPADEVRRFMEEVVQWMGMPAELEVSKTDDRLRIRLVGQELGKYIGRRGETLQALQYLASLVVNRYTERYLPVELDAGDYRARREKSLQQLALRLAEKAVRTGRPVPLEPMSSWERRCVHTALSNHSRVYTESQGEGLQRHVVIFPKAAAKQDNNVTTSSSRRRFHVNSPGTGSSRYRNYRTKGKRRTHPQHGKKDE